MFSLSLFFLLGTAVTSPLTTPEEAQTFLAIMRDKQRAADVIHIPPAHLTADGMNAWHLQQRERERLERERRKEAEALLRGYRMTMSHDKSRVPVKGKERAGLSPLRGQLFVNEMNTISESMDDVEIDGRGETREVGRLSIDESVFRLSQQHRNDRDVGRLVAKEFKSTYSGELGGRKSEEFTNGDRSEFILETPRSDEEKKMDGEGSEYGKEKKPPMSSKKSKSVPKSARDLLPDETEWRDFVSSGTK